MESPDSEEMSRVAAIIAGAGTSGAVAGLVKGVAPTIAPDIAAAGVGLLLYLFGERIHPLVKAYGVGVLAGGLKGTIEKAIPTIGAAPPPTAQGGTGGSAAAAMAEAYAAQQSR